MSFKTVIASVAALLIAAAATAEVRINVTTGLPDSEGRIAVDVVIDSDGESVGGFQNDIVFDHTVARLDRAADCRINRAIGTTPLGTEPGAVTCEDDRTIGPCKTLNSNLAPCAGDPVPDGCPAEAPDYSRFRAIVASTQVPNDNAIPDGIAYTCTFTVVNAAALPLRLFNNYVVVSDPIGRRLESAANDGGICVDDGGSLGCASLRFVDQPCVIDFECASGNCDRCCDHQFNGICAAPRTPTPTTEATATRTPFPTRTPRPPTPTRTATSTPLPQPAGAFCTASEQCASPLSCNAAARVCCTSEVCPGTTSCRQPGFAGYCIGEGARPPGPAGDAEISVSLRSNGQVVGGMQNDIIVDEHVMRIDSADCEIEPSIGLFPLGRDAVNCLEDPTIGPCKNLAKALHQCGLQPQAEGCPSDAGNGVSVFRGIVAAVAAPNNNRIPDGRLYSCRATVVDADGLPEGCAVNNVVVSDPIGRRLENVGIDCRIQLIESDPAPDGTSCSDADDCESGNCVDGVCCGSAACPQDESCAISGQVGTCSARRGVGEGCNFGDDCAEGNCDLLLGSPTSGFRGACGSARAQAPSEGECTGGEECGSGHCVDGFCCARDSCAAGHYCNSGGCALPAEPGARCTADEQCALGLCVDGGCCVTGVCPEGQSCGIVGLEGVCREPLRAGSPCTLDAQCPTGFCTDGACCVVDACPFGFVCSRFQYPGECVERGAEPHEPGSDGESTTPTPTPRPAGASCAPGECASGYCINGICCVDERCEGSDRCDVFGHEGRCVPPLPVDAECVTNSDCALPLLCIADSFGVRRCTVIRPSPTLIPAATRTVGAPPPGPQVDSSTGSDDDGCQLSSPSSGKRFPSVLLLAALALIAVRRRANAPVERP